MKNSILAIEQNLSSEMKLNSLGFYLNTFDDYYAIYLNPKENISHKIVYSLFPIKGKTYLSQLNYSIMSQVVNLLMYSVIDINFNVLEDTVIDRSGFEDSKSMRNSIELIVLENRNIFEHNIKKIGNEFKGYFTEFALPFFNEMESLEDINNKILEKEDWKDWSNYIYGKTYFKAMIILKVVGNDEGYKKFTNMYIPRIEEGIINRGRDDLKQYLAEVKKLDNYLESNLYKDLL